MLPPPQFSTHPAKTVPQLLSAPVLVSPGVTWLPWQDADPRGGGAALPLCQAEPLSPALSQPGR